MYFVKNTDDAGSEASNEYELYSPHPCTVFLKGVLYRKCVCKLEAKDTWFALVHLIGYPKEDVIIKDDLKEDIFIEF